ncbi:MAG: hypothetical protein ACYDEY_06125 [Acidimicrobiales bacterium]
MTTTADARLKRTYRAVVDECELLLASDAFDAWKAAQTLQVGDLIACNNSFLYREGQSTTKSTFYLGIEVSDGLNFTLPPVVVTANSRINSQFKRLAARELSKYNISDLDTALREQLLGLGSIVFSLAGRIGDAEAAEAPLAKVAGVDLLKYVPGQMSRAEVSDSVIMLSSIADLDVSWSAVQAAVAGTDGIDAGALGEAFEAAFHALQEASTRPVDLADVTEDAPSILSNVLERMEQQVKAFATALEQHQRSPDDNDIYNELLRVAYNFADGARAFLRLMVGVCDLKPVIFWLTVFEQVELAQRFEKLPFSLVGKGKPSLERYRSVIADSRNQAFHDLFAFDHPFRVKLHSDALRSPELRLFREYAKRGDSALNFEDRGLVDLLASLTRTPERPVPVGFWQGNKDVMTSVVDTVRALRQALIVIAP